LGSTAPDLYQPTILVLALYGFFYYLQRYTADQTVVQRYLVAKSDRAAIRGIATGTLLCIPVWSLFMLIGTLCWSFYRVTGEKLPAYITKGDQVFPYFITTHLPPGIAGLFMAALFGAAMANLSSDFNSLAAVGVEDYYRIARPAATERRRLLVAKIIVALCGALCVIVATALAHTNGSALSLWYTVSAILGGGLVGLFLLAFLTQRASRTGAYTGIAAGLIFTAYATLTSEGGKLWNLGPYNFPWHNYMIGVIAHLIVLIGGYAVSIPFPNRDPESRELTLWGWLERRRLHQTNPLEMHNSAQQPLASKTFQ
jgi:solute:Na+ symporter, SSS family